MRSIKITTLAGWLTAAIVLSCVGAFAVVRLGIYNVSALAQHTQPVYSVIDVALDYSVQRRAATVSVPDLARRDWRRGMVLYRDHCLQCHGAPGVAPAPFALGMKPVPTAIVEAARTRSPAELYWVVAHGIKMTGMPAWAFRLSEEEIWSVVAAVERLAHLTVPEYAALAQTFGQRHSQPAQSTANAKPPTSLRADLVAQGRLALQQYGCISCHTIPGITGAHTHVGPPLNGIANRAFIAGVLQNTPANMVRWVRFPQQVDPLTAMPPLGVTGYDAQAIAAYLATLDGSGHPMDVLKP